VYSFFTIIFVLRKIKRTQNKILRSLLKSSSILLIIFIPLISILDVNVQKLEREWQILPLGVTFLPLFYFIWNFLSIYYAAQFFFSKPSYELFSQEEVPITETFLKKYNISHREQEIISLLLKKYSYLRIAEECFISLGTVKNHVHNVYQKIGIKDKNQLRNLIKSFQS
jgi:DNA-binding CsgD family transcriptional regulator